MQTQKDQVEAYSFMLGRMTSALVLGDASYLEVPARRSWTGLQIGVLLALFIVGGFLIYGLIAARSAPSVPVQPKAPVVRYVQPSGKG